MRSDPTKTKGFQMNQTKNDAPIGSPAPETIIAARKAAGLTQSAASTLIYAGIRRWQDWEAGTARMHPALFELFCLKAVFADEARPLLERLSESTGTVVLSIAAKAPTEMVPS